LAPPLSGGDSVVQEPQGGLLRILQALVLGTVWCTILFILYIAYFWLLLIRHCELHKSSRPLRRRL
jgi:hypothetical protein